MRLPLAAAALGLASALAACAGPGVTLSGRSCESLFRELDTVEDRVGSAFDDDTLMAVPSAVQPIAGRLRSGDCINYSVDRQGMAAALADPGLPRGSGARAGGGALVSVGAVAGTRADFHTLDYFEALGYHAYSLGVAGVGRRVYVGPLASEAGVAAVMEAARRAGFQHPYVKRSGPSFFGGFVQGG
jgi:hypothetical protein